MLPRLHPVTKTYVELRRCEIRIDEFLAQFPESDTNEAEVYLKLLETIQEAKRLIPEKYLGRTT